MSESKVPYETEVADAMEMLGKGYDDPSLEIVPASSTLQRRGKEFLEKETAAFVKVSTAFKNELAEIDGNDLKVWFFIALSVNRLTGTANPGIRTIAAGCGLDKDTVSRAVKRLEGHGLLTVDRESKKYNIYQPADYVSANKSVPTMGTIEKSVPIQGESVPTNDESVPTRWGLNQSNQSNQKKPWDEKFSNMPLDWLIASGMEIPVELLRELQAKKLATDTFEKALGFGALPWATNAAWEKFYKWVVKIYAEYPTLFQEYAEWRKGSGKYDAMNNKQIRMNPQAFIDTGLPAFEAFKMYAGPKEIQQEPPRSIPAAWQKIYDETPS